MILIMHSTFWDIQYNGFYAISYKKQKQKKTQKQIDLSINKSRDN